jgi:hypothetical protein
MAQRKRESGDQRQERIQREQHRPEQNEGYDEAVRGGPSVANDMRRTTNLVPAPPDVQPANEAHDIDERETRDAVEEVRREEHSASRRRLGERSG